MSEGDKREVVDDITGRLLGWGKKYGWTMLPFSWKRGDLVFVYDDESEIQNGHVHDKNARAGDWVDIWER